jgi:hypothetical protein
LNSENWIEEVIDRVVGGGVTIRMTCRECGGFIVDRKEK